MVGLLLAKARFDPPYATFAKTSVRLMRYRSDDRLVP